MLLIQNEQSEKKKQKTRWSLASLISQGSNFGVKFVKKIPLPYKTRVKFWGHFLWKKSPSYSRIITVLHYYHLNDVGYNKMILALGC